jgi:hypothetical protein
LELITKILPRDHNLFFFGDTHIGSTLCHEKGIKKFINKMESTVDGVPSSGNYAIHMGDAIEGILIDDYRYRPETCETPFFLKQIDAFIDLMWPIHERIITNLRGNHSDTLWKYDDVNARICKKLGLSKPGTKSARITIRDRKKRKMYKIYATHGRKGINSVADDPTRRDTNMKLILKRHLKQKAADCVIMAKGHTHRTLILKPTQDLYLTDDGDNINQHYTHFKPNAKYIHPDNRWYLNTGAFYKAYAIGIDSYAERAEYDPIDLGYIIMKIRDGKPVDAEKVIV